MTKKQKILLAIFLAMFIVPETLWSPVENFMYEFFQDSAEVKPFRDNFLQDPDNINYLSTVLFIQFLGVLATGVYLIFVRRVFVKKVLLWTWIILLLLACIPLFYIFGFSIALRDIGF